MEAVGPSLVTVSTGLYRTGLASEEAGAVPGRGAEVEYRRGVRGASEWRVFDRAGEPVIELRGDVGRLTPDDIADIEAFVAQMVARRTLSIVR